MNIEGEKEVVPIQPTSGYFGPTELASIFAKIEELSERFSSFNVVFVNRDANLVAHLCAQHHSRISINWLNQVTDFVL